MDAEVRSPRDPLLPAGLNRRDFLTYFSGIGLCGTLLPGVLWSRFQEEHEITAQTLAGAERLAGLEFTEEEREAMVRGLNGYLRSFRQLREQSIPNEVPPALVFDPVLPGMQVPTQARPFRPSRAQGIRVPSNLEEVAFWPLTHLAGHPVVVVPSGFNEEGSPVSISFAGGLWKEAEALRVAQAWQEATGHHTRHPPLFSVQG